MDLALSVFNLQTMGDVTYLDASFQRVSGLRKARNTPICSANGQALESGAVGILMSRLHECVLESGAFVASARPGEAHERP
jgi:hypothetical protein